MSLEGVKLWDWVLNYSIKLLALSILVAVAIRFFLFDTINNPDAISDIQKKLSILSENYVVILFVIFLFFISEVKAFMLRVRSFGKEGFIMDPLNNEIEGK